MSTAEGLTHRAVGAGGTIDFDLCDIGVVVVGGSGQVASINARARELVGASSGPDAHPGVSDLEQRVQALSADSSTDERLVEVPGLGSIGVRRYPMDGAGGACVLLLRDVRSLDGTAGILQQAARHRAFTFLARDWAHDLKGMLHVIRINNALLSRLLQREPTVTDAAVTRCLEAIPREVERLDRAIEQMFSVKRGDRPSAFDLGATCQRVKELIAARALRHRVDVVFELNGGPKDVVGFEEQVESALLSLIINALEAMAEQDHGKLLFSAAGHAANVTVRISDTGPGMQPQPGDGPWRPRLVNGPRQTGLGLHVARGIVESHGGRIEYRPNVPRGTSVELTFPTAASTGRL